MQRGPDRAPSVERTEVEVAQDILETYIGEYELAPSRSIVVTLEDGVLFGQPPGQGKATLFAASETEFFLKVIDLEVSFTRDDSDTVTGMILRQDGRSRSARKVK